MPDTELEENITERGMRLFRLPKHKPGAMAGETRLMRLLRCLIILLLFVGVAWGFWMHGRRLQEMTKKNLGRRVDAAETFAGDRPRLLAFPAAFPGPHRP
jgi:hypothetical protein